MARVLAIDDDENLLFVLRQTLESEGHEVVVASDGGEALELLRNLEPLPALIVSDLRMDPVDGREFLRRKSQDPRISCIPVIIVSGEKDTHDLVGFVAAVFEKPYPVDGLLEAVEKVIQKS